MPWVLSIAQRFFVAGCRLITKHPHLKVGIVGSEFCLLLYSSVVDSEKFEVKDVRGKCIVMELCCKGRRCREELESREGNAIDLV